MRRSIMELLALGALRSRGERFADFAAVERERGPQSEAALLKIIGTDAPGFDRAVVTLREMRREVYEASRAQG